MESILKYFGTYVAKGTVVNDAATTISTFKFEYLTSLGIAALVIFFGHALVKRSKLLRKFCIPAPVVSGLIFSIIMSCIKATGFCAFSFDVSTIKDLAQNIFFLCVGFGFSAKMLKKAGGKLPVMIALGAVLIITLQNVVGLAVGSLVGLDPLLSLICSSAAMSGGVGTTGAFGPIYENWGAVDALTIGVAAATLGNVMGSVIGGPVGAFLIKKHNLKSDPNDKPEHELNNTKPELKNGRVVTAFAMVLLLAALGMPFYCLLDNIPMIEMPKFIGCLFAGAIGRNVIEGMGRDTYTPEVNAIEEMWLELYLALTLMSIDFTKLAPVAGQMGLILIAQALLMVLFAIFVSYNLFGRNYGAAVMSAGNVGWSMGAGSNAVANEKAIMDEYGWHNIAWVLYPSFAVIIDDIYNPIILSLLGGFFAH